MTGRDASRADWARRRPPRRVVAAQEQVRAAFGRLRTSAAAIEAAAEDDAADAEEGLRNARRLAAQRRRRDETQAAAEVSELHDTTAEGLRARVEQLATGLALAPWEAAEWASADFLGAEAPRYVRIGSLTEVSAGAAEAGATGPSPADRLPALVPLLDEANLALVSSGAPRPGDPDPAADVLVAVLLRLVASAPAGQLEVVVSDPRISGLTSGLAGLRRGSPRLLSEPLLTGPELLVALRRLRGAVARVAELSGADDLRDLGALVAATGQQPEPYRVLVVLGYPYGVDEEVQTELLRLARSGPRRGVCLVVQHDRSVPSASGVDPAALLAHTVVVGDAPGGLVSVPVLGDALVRPDPRPPRALVERVCDSVARRVRAAAVPTVDLAGLLPPPGLVWTRSAADGVAAALGRDGPDLVGIELRSADPALPNVLIGGASGQGKSTLLQVLLHSVATMYSPDEVEMVLLDHTDGPGLDRLGPQPDRPHWLPHATVLGTEGDRVVGLGVLRHVDGELRRRAEGLRAAGAGSLSAYRQARPGERLPRTLLVVDGLDVLLRGDDQVAQEAVALLETLARRGRATGIHLVLAAQTLAGIPALAPDGAILGQVPWRVCLRTDRAESERVLGPGNDAAARLRFRGEVVLNAEYGAPEHNRRAVVASGADELFDEVRAALFARWPDPRAPQVFAGRDTGGAGEVEEWLRHLDGDEDR